MAIRIGTRISKDWLDRPEDLNFIKQINVDYVDIVLDMVPGFDEAGGLAVSYTHLTLPTTPYV